MKKRNRNDDPESFPERQEASPLLTVLDRVALINKDTPYTDTDRGWRALIAMILLQAVSDACQMEDEELAAEARDWLSSKAAAVLFHFCQINYLSVKEWLENRCPLPDEEKMMQLLTMENQAAAAFEYLGVHWGTIGEANFHYFVNDEGEETS